MRQSQPGRRRCGRPASSARNLSPGHVDELVEHAVVDRLDGGAAPGRRRVRARDLEPAGVHGQRGAVAEVVHRQAVSQDVREGAVEAGRYRRRPRLRPRSRAWTRRSPCPRRKYSARARRPMHTASDSTGVERSHRGAVRDAPQVNDGRRGSRRRCRRTKRLAGAARGHSRGAGVAFAIVSALSATRKAAPASRDQVRGVASMPASSAASTPASLAGATQVPPRLSPVWKSE